MKADRRTATTDARTIPCRWIDPNLTERPDRPAINITDVRTRFMDFE